MPRKAFREYTKEEIEAIEAMFKAGFTQEKISKLLGYRSSATFSRHASKQPELKEVIKRGVSLAVATVASALFKKATGYDYYEEIYETVGEDDNGEPILKLKRRTKKHVAADTFAANSFLNNRAPDEWKSNRDSGGKALPNFLIVQVGGKEAKKLTEAKKEIEADFEVVGDSKD